MANSAALTVFNIPELLLMILEYLPNRKLMCIQRVSRRWQGIMLDSETLRQRLFLTPKGSPIGPFMADGRTGRLEFPTELDLNRIPTCQFTKWELIVDSEEEEEEEEVEESPAVTYGLKLGWRGKHHDEHSSCDRMFLSQPPCTTVACAIPDMQPEDGLLWYSVQNLRGSRFEDLVSAHDAAMRGHPHFCLEQRLRYVVCMPLSYATAWRWEHERENCEMELADARREEQEDQLMSDLWVHEIAESDDDDE